MKKALLTLVVVIATMTMMRAQTGLHLGVQGQFNSTWILNQNSYEGSQMDYEYRFGPCGGITLGYNWLDNYGIQLEFNYASMGQYYSDLIRDYGPYQDPLHPTQQTAVLTYRNIDLNYIQVPVLFKYMEGDKKDAIKYHMYGGLQFGYLLSATQAYTADIDDNGKQVAIPQTVAPQSQVPVFDDAYNENYVITPSIDYFSKIDLGILIDIGADIYVNDKIYFTPGLRVNYGLLDINAPDTKNLNPRRGENIYKASHNAFVGINLGFNFMLQNVVFGKSDDSDE